MAKAISLNDIKFDLLKIIEPWDGVLESTNPRPVRQLFIAYLNDLQREKMIYDFAIDTSERPAAFTFDINVRMGPTRSPKKLKIHIRAFTQPWCDAA
jgi:hypothetical protein